MSMSLPRVRSTSLLVVFCGVVAVLYIIYRICLLAFPAVALGDELLHPQAAAPLVCSEENDDNLPDPRHEWSARYQMRVADQKALSPNLAKNSSVANTADNTPVRLKKNATYRYEFWYRSQTPTSVTFEYRTPAKKQLQYEHAAFLPAASKWQRFTAHVNTGQKMETLRVIAGSDEPGHIDTRGYALRQIPSASLSRGMVTVAFDDGWQSIAEHAAPLLQNYGIRSTQYIISDVSAHKTPGYMDYETIHALKNAGHEIGSHSMAHCNQTSLTPAQLTDIATGSKQQLETQGLGPIRSFAYPLGQYNAATQAVYPQHYTYIRSSDAGFNDRYFDATNIRSMGILDTTTEAELQQWLDDAKANKQWVVLVYHRVDESGTYSVTRQQLNRQLAMVARSGLDVLPLGEAADAILRQTPPAPTPSPKQRHAPAELPKTGAAIDAIGLLGVVGLLASGIYWQQSKRRLSQPHTWR